MTAPSRIGKLVTLEGGEGAGKSTVLDAVRARLASHGIPVVVTREPGGTPFGEAVRTLVLDPTRGDVCAESELAADVRRARAARARSDPAGIGSRQVGVVGPFHRCELRLPGRGAAASLPRASPTLEHWAALLKPDLTLLLDLPVAEGLARAGARGEADRIEREAGGFLRARARSPTRSRAAAEPARFRVIDASQPVDAVRAAACAAIDAFVPSVGAGA